MLNYIKSEVYRLKHTKSSYAMIISFSVLAILSQYLLYQFKSADAAFSYATTEFSFGFMAGNRLQMILILCLVLTSTIFGAEFKHRTIKNVVSFGISRNKLFIGKYLVTLIYAFLYMFIVGSVYIVSAYLLLENSGNEYLILFLKSFLVNIPIFISCVTLGVSLFFTVQNETTGTWIWFILIIVIPTLLSFMGQKVDRISELANWMPWNMINMGERMDIRYVYDWETTRGALRCFLSGTGFTLIFFFLGLGKFQTTQIN